MYQISAEQLKYSEEQGNKMNENIHKQLKINLNSLLISFVSKALFSSFSHHILICKRQ
jgi:hypothetical protein